VLFKKIKILPDFKKYFVNIFLRFRLTKKCLFEIKTKKIKEKIRAAGSNLTKKERREWGRRNA